MTDKIQSVNLTDAAEKLRETIQSAFVALIPAEQWQAMIAAELKRFTTPSETYDNYGGRKVVESPLSQLCQKALAERVSAELAVYLKDLDRPLDTMGTTIKAMMVKWLNDNRDKMIRDVFNGAMLGILQAAVMQAVMAIPQKMPDPTRPGYARDGTWIGL